MDSFAVTKRKQNFRITSFWFAVLYLIISAIQIILTIVAISTVDNEQPSVLDLDIATIFFVIAAVLVAINVLTLIIQYTFLLLSKPNRKYKTERKELKWNTWHIVTILFNVLFFIAFIIVFAYGIAALFFGIEIPNSHASIVGILLFVFPVSIIIIVIDFVVKIVYLPLERILKNKAIKNYHEEERII